MKAPLPLRERLPEGTVVEVVSSDHPWLSPGERGAIHWNHARSVLPTLRVEAEGGRKSVQLVSPRDKIRVVR